MGSGFLFQCPGISKRYTCLPATRGLGFHTWAHTFDLRKFRPSFGGVAPSLVQVKPLGKEARFQSCSVKRLVSSWLDPSFAEVALWLVVSMARVRSVWLKMDGTDVSLVPIICQSP